MKLHILRYILWLFPLSTYAGFHDLYDEFIANNLDLQNQRAEVTKLELDYYALKIEKGWLFSSDLYYNNSGLQNLNQFIPNQTKTTNFSYNLHKAFTWGGELNFSHGVKKYDLSSWNSASLASNSSRPFENFFSLRFSQNLGRDFFGRSFKKRLQSQSLLTDTAKKQNKYQEAQKSLDFFQAYTNALLIKKTLFIKKSFIDNAKRREKLILRRSKEGLTNKVDYYLAKNNRIVQEESQRNTAQQLSDSLKEISLLLNRKVIVEEIIAIDTFENEGKIHENLQLAVIHKNIEQAKMQLDYLQKQFFPEIKFYAQYSANSVDRTLGTTFSESFAGDFNEKVVGIQISVPLGYPAEKIQKAKTRIDLKLSERGVEKITKNLEATLKSLRENTKLLKKNITSTQNRVLILKKSLKEANRLYRLARISLDSILDSENQLIQAQISLTNAQTSLHNLHAAQAHIYGKLEDFIKKVVEKI